ncbi:2,3,4,5-tetrahydropyridine-2,6-dicarboxylate N-acetyltransferase [Clostridium acetireducens DSM 10703]|jgi:carbonic anhydrase/acetyltransferase-like protein (isoleucine patch superfamily)|uniref:2,3,4,5-tetrahydropyridine-2,6-dicarboxylate N-acetyltransferase n=1 Tax=Clostridium acetireducens DSM 10703 TaxID=1121290 RepID=A0A1E8EXG1_9CLOT|nr:gamma carbonic anhydrase family protein [Clostridium acetireducens]OFI05469.1 2,3,4,5-tetrahydropyridine-2,6-dicarboxylate N-acetyltransferase [Clostridium acetireducens DSM 10703]
MIGKFNDKYPKVHSQCFIAKSAEVIGEVYLEENSSIWFGSVVRADTNKIYIGKGSNIQDNCTVHINQGDSPVKIGENVTVGHGAILHGCIIGDNSLIGMGAIILDNVEIGENTIIGAGSLVTSNKKIPSGVLCMGSPAKVIRNLTKEEIYSLKENAEHYMEMAKEYKVQGY